MTDETHTQTEKQKSRSDNAQINLCFSLVDPLSAPVKPRIRAV